MNIIPDRILGTMSEPKQVAYFVYQDMSKTMDKINKYHTTTQKEISAEYRGYLIQVSAISAAIIGIVGGLGANSNDWIMRSGLCYLTATVVLGVFRALMSTEKSAIGIQNSYNNISARMDKIKNAFLECIESEDDSEDGLQKAYRTQLEEQEKVENKLEPLEIVPDMWARLIFLLFGSGVVFLTLSFIL